MQTWLKRIGFAILLLAGLGVLAFVFENQRGRREWENYRLKLEAQGEHFDIEALAPSPVPDEENFAMTPLLASLFDYERDESGQALWRDKEAFDRVAKAFAWTHERGRPATWEQMRFLDLGRLQNDLREDESAGDAALRALLKTPRGSPEDDFLFLLNESAAMMDEIQRATMLPHCVFPIHYDDNMDAVLPHLGFLKKAASAFRIRAVIELSRGDTTTGLEDALVCLKLSDTIRDEPLIISALVRIATLKLALQPVWEGLNRRQWTEPQLATIQAQLENINLVAEHAHALKGERAMEISLLDMLRHDPARFFELARSPGEEPEGGTSISAMQAMPKGWIRQNQLTIARAFENYILPPFHPADSTIDLAQSRELNDAFDKEFSSFSPYRIFGMMLLPSVGRSMEKVRQAQNCVNLARIACALERHYLVHGNYPGALQELKPQFLTDIPLDALNGQPLIYRRTVGGRYLIHSVGLNLKDDGGVPPPPRTSASRQENSDSDIVWGYEPPESSSHESSQAVSLQTDGGATTGH